MIEKIKTHLHLGDHIDVHSKQTATIGKFMGIVISEEGEPMIALQVGEDESAPPVVYGFGEVKKIDVADDAIRGGVREVERAVTPDA